MKMHLDLSHMISVAGGDIEKIDTKADPFPGVIARLYDKFGSERIFELVQNRAGATLAQSSLVSAVGDANGLTSVANILSGSTTHAVTAGLTASKHEGALMYVLDVAASAGAAPEGECAPILKNSTTRIDLDPEFPLSAALAVNDDLSLRATWQVEAAAISDINTTVKGVVISEDGILDTYFGWVQRFGICPRVLVKAATALAAGEQIIADTARIAPVGAASTHRLVIGKALFVLTSDSVLDLSTVFLTCGESALGLSDQDANAAA